MPTIQPNQVLAKNSEEILNTIRDNASPAYQSAVPRANMKAGKDGIKAIGEVLMTYPVLQNEFIEALVNRIGRVLITSKMYNNPWAKFKKGLLEFGETVEEIFVNLAKPFQFDPETAETELFKREIPDVKSSFHIMNYQKFYKDTISNDQLRQAFLGWDGITDLIAKIVDSMYTSANYDEFQTMKYLLARHILSGKMNPVTVPTVEKVNMGDIVSVIKGISNDMEFMKTTYNLAGVYTHSEKNDQYLLINSKFDASMDVNVLAAAFNMEKAEFMGHRTMVDSFGSLDKVRLAQLFAGDSTFKLPTDAELKALDSIPVVLVDKGWFMVFDNFYNFTEQYNGQGLYWNYMYHVWKTFSVSPFANNALFVPGTPTVNAVTVSPKTATVLKGQSLQLSAVVATDFFAPQGVIWSVNSSHSSISASGMLTVPTSETATSLTVTATSVYDSTKTDTATITVG